jgi:hypothetical protein
MRRKIHRFARFRDYLPALKYSTRPSPQISTSPALFAGRGETEEIDMSIRERILRRRRYQLLVRELSEFSHHELIELGIAPADIGRVAWHAVYAEPTGRTR